MINGPRFCHAAVVQNQTFAYAKQTAGFQVGMKSKRFICNPLVLASFFFRH